MPTADPRRCDARRIRAPTSLRAMAPRDRLAASEGVAGRVSPREREDGVGARADEAKDYPGVARSRQGGRRVTCEPARLAWRPREAAAFPSRAPAPAGMTAPRRSSHADWQRKAGAATVPNN